MATFKRVAGNTSYPLTVAGWRDKYLIRGASLAGIPAGQVGYFFDDFADLSRWSVDVGGDAPTAVLLTPGGVVEVGATPGSYGWMEIGWGAEYPSIIKGNGLWYMATRLKLNRILPVGAGQVVLQFTGTGGGLKVGSLGSSLDPGGTKFAMMYEDGHLHPIEYVYSTVDLDLLWHTLEVWCDGSKYYISVDGETPVVKTPTNPAHDYYHLTLDTEPDLAAPVSVQYDKLLLVFPQAS